MISFADLKTLLNKGVVPTGVTLKELTMFCEEVFPELEWLVRSDEAGAFANLYKRERDAPPHTIHPAYGATPEQALASSISLAWNRRKEQAQ